MTIMERVRTRPHERRTTESRPAASERPLSPLVELRQQPPPAHVAVRGRAVEMVGLPPLRAPAPPDQGDAS